MSHDKALYKSMDTSANNLVFFVQKLNYDDHLYEEERKVSFVESIIREFFISVSPTVLKYWQNSEHTLAHNNVNTTSQQLPEISAIP